MMFKVGNTIKIKPPGTTPHEEIRQLYESKNSIGVISGYEFASFYEIIWGVPKVHKRVLSSAIVDVYYELVD